MKSFLKYALALLAFSTVLCTQFGGLKGAELSKPNIVYILADDLGYGDVHCLNPERCKIKTPHVDKMAAAGMIFSDAHSSSSVCTPTRYGVMTGRYNWRTRMQSGVLNGYSEPLIAADRLTVPALLNSTAITRPASANGISAWGSPKGRNHRRSPPAQRRVGSTAILASARH